MSNKIRPDRRAAGFSLVELMIVIGVIALLVSLLIPALSKARDSANSTRCANNLRQAGVSIRAFAQDHDGRVPYTQTGIGSPIPMWDNLMYSHDYFELVDRYGLTTKTLLCPSSSTSAGELTPVLFQSGAQTELQARQASGALTGIQSLGPANDPDNPTYSAQVSTGVGAYYVNFNCYAYMGYNNQFSIAGGQPTYWVLRITSQTKTGTPVDSSPPIMADQTFYQPGGLGYVYNHGRNWNIPSMSGSTASVHEGTIMVNVLYVDNHVDSKAPDVTSYVTMPGSAYCFR